MAKQIKLRRGTTSEHRSFTGGEAEITYDSDKKTIVVHDGETQGGHPVLLDEGDNGKKYATCLSTLPSTVPDDLAEGSIVIVGNKSYQVRNGTFVNFVIGDTDGLIPVGSFADMREEDMGECWLRADGGTALIADYPQLAALYSKYYNFGAASEVISNCPYGSRENYYLDIENGVFGFSCYTSIASGMNIGYTLDFEHFYVARMNYDSTHKVFFYNSEQKLIYLSKTGLGILYQRSSQAGLPTTTDRYSGRYYIIQLSGESITIKAETSLIGRTFSGTTPTSTNSYPGSEVLVDGNYLMWLGFGKLQEANNANSPYYQTVFYKYDISSNKVTEYNFPNAYYGGGSTGWPALISGLVKAGTNKYYFCCYVNKSNTFQVFYTQDGGASWSLRYTMTTSNQLYYFLQYLREDSRGYSNSLNYSSMQFCRNRPPLRLVNGRIIVGYYSGLNTSYGIYYSTDYGASWTKKVPKSTVIASAAFVGAEYKNGWYYLGYLYYNSPSPYYQTFYVVKTQDFVNYTFVVNYQSKQGSADTNCYGYRHMFMIQGNYFVFCTIQAGAMRTPMYFDMNGNCLTEYGYMSISSGWGNQIYSEDHDLIIQNNKIYKGYGTGIFTEWSSQNNITFFPKDKDFGIKITYGGAGSGKVEKIPLRSYNKETEFILPTAKISSSKCNYTINNKSYTGLTLNEGYRCVRAK